MVAPISPVVRILVSLLLMFAVSSCGGGGDSSSSTGTETPQNPNSPSDNFTISAGTLSFVRQINAEGSMDLPRLFGTVTGINENVFINALIINPASAPVISDARFQISGTSGELVVIPVSASSLGVGTHRATIEVSVCLDANCNNHVNGSPKTVEFTYRVVNEFYAESIEESVVFGNASVIESNIRLQAYDIPWKVENDMPWLTLETESAEASVGMNMLGAFTRRLNYTIDTTQLPVGEHTGTLEFTRTDTNETFVSQVNFNHMAPDVSLRIEAADYYGRSEFHSIGGESGFEFVFNKWRSYSGSEDPDISVDVFFPDDLNGALSTTVIDQEEGHFQHERRDEGTFQANRQTKFVDGSGVTNTELVVEYTSRDTTFSVTESIPVNIANDYLITNNLNLGFIDTPGAVDLDKTIDVSTLFGNEHFSWQATSNADWLLVTPDGTTGTENLTVTASSSGLAKEQLHKAKITLTSQELDNQVEVFVSFWISEQDSVFPVVDNGNQLYDDGFNPYLYVYDDEGNLHAFHMHTGELVGTIANLGAENVSFTSCPDGKCLLVLVEGRLLEIAPEGFEVINTFEFDNLENVFDVEYIQVKGKDVLVTNLGTVLSLEDGALITTLRDITGEQVYGSVIKKNDFGNVVCLTSSPLHCHLLGFSSSTGQIESMVFHRSHSGVTAISRDGTRLFSGPYLFGMDQSIRNGIDNNNNTTNDAIYLLSHGSSEGGQGGVPLSFNDDEYLLVPEGAVLRVFTRWRNFDVTFFDVSVERRGGEGVRRGELEGPDISLSPDNRYAFMLMETGELVRSVITQ